MRKKTPRWRCGLGLLPHSSSFVRFVLFVVRVLPCPISFITRSGAAEAVLADEDAGVAVVVDLAVAQRRVAALFDGHPGQGVADDLALAQLAQAAGVEQHAVMPAVADAAADDDRPRMVTHDDARLG